jgi:hypothetical protein
MFDAKRLPLSENSRILDPLSRSWKGLKITILKCGLRQPDPWVKSRIDEL